LADLDQVRTTLGEVEHLFACVERRQRCIPREDPARGPPAFFRERGAILSSDSQPVPGTRKILTTRPAIRHARPATSLVWWAVSFARLAHNRALLGTHRHLRGGRERTRHAVRTTRDTSGSTVFIARSLDARDTGVSELRRGNGKGTRSWGNRPGEA